MLQSSLYLYLSVNFNSVSSNMSYALISLIEAEVMGILMTITGFQNLPEAYQDLTIHRYGQISLKNKIKSIYNN